MDGNLSTSLIRKQRKSKSYGFEKVRSFQGSRLQSVRIKKQVRSQNIDQQSNHSNAGSEQKWQKSNLAEQSVPNTQSSKMKPKKKQVLQSNWFGVQQKERTLNDTFFNLTPEVQKIVYLVNYVLNIAIRIAFINLLVFLGLSEKWIYLETFLSLEGLAIIIYLIVMIKMLFTRSDKESVYFQKMFNQSEWTDIQSQRLMRNHFNLARIVTKACVFFNPFTKFQKNTKISFLRQQLFKRMELVLVYIPFSVVFFIRPNDFITANMPNFNIYITAVICLQAIRSACTYLVVYVYS